MKGLRSFKKTLTYVLTTALLLSCAAGLAPIEAHAATTGTVNADVLNVRSGASTSYSRVGTVTQGTTVTITGSTQGSDGYTWYKITGSVSGYVRGDYISNVSGSVASSGGSGSVGIVTADLLNVRTGAGTNYSRLGTINYGTRVTIISSTGSWYKVTCTVGGVVRTGYVSAEYISRSEGSGSTGNTGGSTGGSTTVIGTGIVNADALNVREGAGTSYNSKGLIRRNDKVEILEDNGSWLKVSCSLGTGYVASEYITRTGSGSSGSVDTSFTGKGVVNADALNVREGAGTSYNSKGLIRTNEQVEILGKTGSWYKIKCSLGEGYVSAEYITLIDDSSQGGSGSGSAETPDTPVENKKGVVNADALNVRTGPGTGYTALGLIYQGASVTIKGENNGWYKVSCVINGTAKEGYVSAEFITLTSDSGSGGGSGNTGGSGGSGSTGGGTSVANKQGIVKADALNFRSGPGTNYGSIGLVYIGTQVTILEETNGWYKVTCVINGVPKTGYMSAEFITVVGANDEPWEGDPDESFEEQIADFPESYKNALRRLHEQHPSWKFVAKYTGLDFEDSVSIQNSGNRSMIYVSSTTPFSWLSTAPGDYDWATDTYYNKDGASWKGASKELIAYYMDPRNFLDESQIFMFESQAYDPSQSRNVVAGILDGTFMEDGKGYYYNGSFKTYVDTFMEAGAIANVSPYILASRSRQEVGSYSGSVSGESGYYNFFNIGAYASSSGNAVTNGLNYAATPGSYRRPWTNQYLSIVGGAEFLAESYIARGQNTDYFQKFNVVSSPYHSHQYMGNIQAPSTEGLSRYTTYEELGVLDEAMTFIIPVYDNMPASAAAMPAPTGNPNSYIKSLSVSGASLNATFTYNKLDYTAVVSNSTTGITISATPVSQYGTIISGTGYHSLNVGNNTIEVVCQAGNGTTTTYTIVVYRSN